MANNSPALSTKANFDKLLTKAKDTSTIRYGQQRIAASLRIKFVEFCNIL